MKQVLFTLLFFAVIGPVAMAQSDLPEEKKAICCFDLRVQQLLSSELGQAIVSGGIDMSFKEMEFPIPADKYVRIFGLIGAPNSMQEVILSSGNDDFPYGMFFECQMTDAESCRQLFDSMQLDDNSGREINGVEYFSPPSRGPQNIIVGITNETTLVMGTKDFVLTARRKAIFSNELTRTWGRQNDSPFRLSAEMVSKADFIHEAIVMGKEDVPPMFSAVFDLIDNVESLNIMMDPSADELLAVRGIGKNDAEALELRVGLDSLIGFAKLASGSITAELESTPKMAAMVSAAIQDLSTSGEGREFNIIINRPEGMNEAVLEFIKMAVKNNDADN